MKTQLSTLPCIIGILTFAFCTLLLCPPVIAMKTVDGGQGQMLLLEAKEEKQNIRVTGAQVRDPFNWTPEVMAAYRAKFSEYAATVFSELNLSGIIWNAEKPMAIIDNTLLREGEKIKDIEVVLIGKNSVLLRKGTEQYTLELEKLIIDLGSE